MFSFFIKSILGFLGMFLIITRALFTNFILMFILLAASIAFIYASCIIWGSPVRLLRDKTPIEFEVSSVDGGSYMSRGFKGRKYVLYFTSVACEKCIDQIPVFAVLKKEHGIHSYAVFNDREIKMLIDKNLEKYSSVFGDVWVDKMSRLAHANYAYMLPHTMVVDENGERVVDITGKLTPKDIQRILKAFNVQKDVVIVKEEGDKKSNPANK